MTETTGPSFRMRPGGLYLKASWALVVIGVLEATIGLAQLALRATTQDPDRVLLALNLAFVITGLALAGAGLLNRHIYRTAETRLTPQGLINRERRTRLIPWNTITAITPIRRGRYWRTRVTLTNGRQKILTAPTTKTPQPDPTFTRDLETIHHWWHHHRDP